MNFSSDSAVLSFIFGLLAVGLFSVDCQGQYVPGSVHAGKPIDFVLEPPPQPEEEGVADSWLVEPGITLHHFGEGKGPAILILHGGPGYPPARPWPALTGLSQGHQLHYFHQRGCGHSSNPISKPTGGQNFFANMTQLDRALGLGTQIADVERIRRILDEESIILLGHSFGAFIATLYAIEFPERVRALVLLAPAGVLTMPPMEGGIYEQVASRLTGEDAIAFADFRQRYFNFGQLFEYSNGQMSELNREFVPFYCTALGIDENAASGVDVERIGGWVSHAIFLSMGMQYDHREHLKKILCPALVIHAADDLQPVAVSRSYSDSFPNAQFEILEGENHFFVDREESKLGNTIQQFLDRLPSETAEKEEAPR